MTETFKSLDHSEYKGFRYEADSSGNVCVFDKYTQYLAAFKTTAEADAFVDSLDGAL